MGLGAGPPRSPADLALLRACGPGRAPASTMSVEAPWPESDLPATRTCTSTCPRLSPPGVTDWIARFTTSMRRSTTALIAAIAAAIGPLPLAVALRSPDHGPVSRTVAEAGVEPQVTSRWARP